MSALHRFFWEETKTRAAVYALTAVAGISLATVRTLAFHRSEREVALELVAFILISNLLLLLFYCARGRVASFVSVIAPPRLPLALRLSGLVACVILLCAPQFSVSTVQAAIVNRRLKSAASSISPAESAHLSSDQLQARFKKITSIANASIGYEISANPVLVEQVKNNLEQTLKSANVGEGEVRKSGVTAFVALVAYARTNNVLISINTPVIWLGHGETGNMMLSQVPLKNGARWWQGSPEGNTIFALPTPVSEPVFPISNASVVFNSVNFMSFGGARSFVGTDNKSQVAVMNATIEGVAQKLDGVVWLNIEFKNSLISYSGGPLYLGNVTFKNCKFEFANDSESQKILTQISAVQNEPVTLVSGL